MQAFHFLAESERLYHDLVVGELHQKMSLTGFAVIFIFHRP